MGIFKLSLCSELSPAFALVLTESNCGALVYTIRVSLAIYGSNNLQLSEVSVVRFHRFTYGFVVRRNAEETYGHW